MTMLCMTSTSYVVMRWMVGTDRQLHPELERYIVKLGKNYKQIYVQYGL